MRTLLLMMLSVLPLAAQARILPDQPVLLVSYIEKPPYYYTDGRQAKGFLLRAAEQVFDRAGIAVELVARPAKRVLHEVETNAFPTCSIGWFKSSERVAFAKFSAPIYQDKPMAVLTERSREAAVRKHGSLRALAADGTMRIGVTDGFSYGPYIDQLLQGSRGAVDHAVGSPAINLKKLALGRIDYTLVDAAELDYLSGQADISRARLVTVAFDDIPPGNQRYLMCSKRVDDSFMARINAAIRTLGTTH